LTLFNDRDWISISASLIELITMEESIWEKIKNMICINCKKLISKGEEIILRDLKVPKFCKQCSEKIAERCHSCR